MSSSTRRGFLGVLIGLGGVAGVKVAEFVDSGGIMLKDASRVA